ncbi:pectate lyase-like adhesive domain-containing protein [uncultured Methanobrevibacter sp.]|uniref:pectate lyase-like adhesive domain-containing protein n=1 Tax=uncultured Methanobrevibacter sp. TaxID=253161 RepID=UPI0025D9E96A|nr:pectate lyase-like adhesive domain-containing protein [uncultured Methanobrevibacter sp.]
MNKFKIFLILLVLFISINAVYSEGNFTELQTEINNSTGSIEITQDYVYVNESDYDLTDGILINKSTLFINGNGHTIDGAGQSRIFYMGNNSGQNITISNLKIINGYSHNSGGSISGLEYNLINVTFENNFAVYGGGALTDSFLNIANCTFINNTAEEGGAVSAAVVEMENCTFDRNYAPMGPH